MPMRTRDVGVVAVSRRREKLRQRIIADVNAGVANQRIRRDHGANHDERRDDRNADANTTWTGISLRSAAAAAWSKVVEET